MTQARGIHHHHHHHHNNNSNTFNGTNNNSNNNNANSFLESDLRKMKGEWIIHRRRSNEEQRPTQRDKTNPTDLGAQIMRMNVLSCILSVVPSTISQYKTILAPRRTGTNPRRRGLATTTEFCKPKPAPGRTPAAAATLSSAASKRTQQTYATEQKGRRRRMRRMQQFLSTTLALSTLCETFFHFSETNFTTPMRH